MILRVLTRQSHLTGVPQQVKSLLFLLFHKTLGMCFTIQKSGHLDFFNMISLENQTIYAQLTAVAIVFG
jgi:hypothetical protein